MNKIARHNVGWRKSYVDEVEPAILELYHINFTTWVKATIRKELKGMGLPLEDGARDAIVKPRLELPGQLEMPAPVGKSPPIKDEGEWMTGDDAAPEEPQPAAAAAAAAPAEQEPEPEVTNTWDPWTTPELAEDPPDPAGPTIEIEKSDEALDPKNKDELAALEASLNSGTEQEEEPF